jgi:hypothetical protein
MAAAYPSTIVGWPIVGEGGRSIANVSWLPKAPWQTDDLYRAFFDECLANAKLIAAAPKMLNALENISARLANLRAVIRLEREISGTGRQRFSNVADEIERMIEAAIEDTRAEVL